MCIRVCTSYTCMQECVCTCLYMCRVRCVCVCKSMCTCTRDLLCTSVCHVRVCIKSVGTCVRECVYVFIGCVSSTCVRTKVCYVCEGVYV